MRPAQLAARCSYDGGDSSPTSSTPAGHYVGAAFIRNSVWPLALLPIILSLLFLLVIRREEAYLADAFGEHYAAYCRRVRRWF